MANHHYGEIGDIWKHLPLAELLSIESPDLYWESHAGSSQYQLTHSPERDYGVFYLLRNAHQSTRLNESAYQQLLEQYQANGHSATYPGSPLIAMSLLTHQAKFLFCDIDPDSLTTIRNDAQELNIAEKRVRTVEKDGISTLSEALESLRDEEAENAIIHIDPFQPFTPGDNNLRPIDLFCRASARKAKTLFWYGFNSYADYEYILEGIENAFHDNNLDQSNHHLWRGEIQLDIIEESDYEFNPGILGCGILTSNLGPELTSVCKQLGEELASIYSSATLPGGQSGAIQFEETTY